MNIFDEVYMAGSQRASSELLIGDLIKVYSDCFVTENNLVSQCILLAKSSLESIRKDFLLDGTRVTNIYGSTLWVTHLDPSGKGFDFPLYA